jgi:hypothetical protein
LAPAAAGLGRPDVQHAQDLHHDLGHLDRAAQQVHPTAAQPGQLPDPQAPVGADQHQRPVARVDGVARVATSAGVRKRISSRSTLGSGTRRQGDWPSMPASTAAPSTLPSSW